VTAALRVLLIEPYCGGSHRAWAEGYARHSRHQVDLLTMPARFWKWRMEGAAATLAEEAARLPERPDVLLVTDMLNLPAFLGLTRRYLGDMPAVLYCHENQLTYPFPPGEKRDLTYGLINWLSMLAADRVLFNSHYHQAAWFDELPRLLKHFPDYTHLHRIAGVQAKSSVLPVGCDLRRFDQVPEERQADAPPLILWNQRWEYDKDPATFFRALDVLAQEGVAFRVALAGENVRQEPHEFIAARERLGERVVHYGHASRQAYAHLLRQADVVVSTAIHEFFGVAIVEAIYCGCFPVLPRRLSYPELIPAAWQQDCLYDDWEGLLARLRRVLSHPERRRQATQALRTGAARFDWNALAPAYDAVMAETLSQVSRQEVPTAADSRGDRSSGTAGRGRSRRTGGSGR
jgi:glycosyltransferase involved in cell wall biosynthesis